MVAHPGIGTAERKRCAILFCMGGGVPDLLVGWRGANYLVEIKNPSGRRSR
jgi:hypothetical protein